MTIFRTKEIPLRKLHRLTLVAFVFIPLNFATSFFGMNIQQLGTGSIHIGFFFLTAILAGGLGVLLATSVKPVERALLRERTRIAGDWYVDVEYVQRREILRQSKMGQRVINAMTVTDSDGNAVFGDDHGFRTVVIHWCQFHIQRLWAVVGGLVRPFRGGRANVE